MTKTQIQVPEDLFAEIKEFAHQLETYAHDAPPASKSWRPPTSRRVGWKGLAAEQIAGHRL